MNALLQNLLYGIFLIGLPLSFKITNYDLHNMWIILMFMSSNEQDGSVTFHRMRHLVQYDILPNATFHRPKKVEL